MVTSFIAAVLIGISMLGDPAAADAGSAKGYDGDDFIAPLLTPARLPDAEQPLSRIGFGSCLKQNLPQPIWQGVINSRPDLFMMIGDNVYGDVRSPGLDELKLAYHQQATHPDFARAREALPMLAVWDDHDFGENDAGGDFKYKDRTRDLFYRFWQVPQSRRRTDGVEAAYLFGPPEQRVQIILLDTRSSRSPLRKDPKSKSKWGPYLPDPDPEKTLLGAKQWAWLGGQLLVSAKIRIIVSSIQVLAEGQHYEKWGNFPVEKDRLFEMIKNTQAKGVIFISGDRHFGALYKRPNDLGISFYDLTSSSLNAPMGQGNESDSNRLGKEFHQENFGMIDIDWPTRRLNLQLQDIRGGTLLSQTITFDEIGIE